MHSIRLFLFLLLVTGLNGCKDNAPVKDSGTETADRQENSSSAEKPLPKRKRLTSLELPAEITDRIERQLVARALYLDTILPGTAYLELDTTSFEQQYDVVYELGFHNDHLVGVKTSRSWCAAYCSGDFYGSIFRADNGERLNSDDIFASPTAAGAFRKKVNADFQQRLADHLKKLKATDSDIDEIESLTDYCTRWNADDFQLTPTGFYFNQDCDMPHVIQAYDFTPDLIYPYAEVAGLRREWFGLTK